MTQRVPGIRRAQGLALMGAGVLLMLVFIGMVLGEVTPDFERTRFVVLIVAVVAFAAGLILYGLARATPP